MEDDQDNIRIIKIENECAKLKEEAHQDRQRALRIEECEDLRDAQLKCLKDFIDKYLPTYIEKGGGHGWKVLEVPKAKE